MTIYELAKRDLRRAENNLIMAMKRPNIPQAELEHLEELVDLRADILDLVEQEYGKTV
jgi:hypothetical protein